MYRDQAQYSKKPRSATLLVIHSTVVSTQTATLTNFGKKLLERILAVNRMHRQVGRQCARESAVVLRIIELAELV